ncbi:DUF5916 domain-containing protein [Gemmatimonas sp.]|uniref:DUF5916 domain-containing protein n=1 Tax=Gemmatimonas sp. TaxID=1962908 RepID=UPI00286D440C|nr:DUF5916 domain-containing protein [Gemmatimonas sp.]
MICLARVAARLRSPRTLAVVLAALGGLCINSLGAQPSPKVARAVRLARAPRIDGRLDDAAWSRIEPITDFLQRQPAEGQAPTEATEVFIAYDAEALYVGARMRRRDPKDLARAVTRRDGFGNAEKFTITFDPQMDRRTAVGFGVSVAGVRSDFRHTQDDDMRGRESQYDPVWTAATREDASGWTAEMRIPFSQLRFPKAERQRWGMQIDRWMPDKNEDVQWAMVSPRETGYVSRFGTLEGLDGVSPTRPVEFMPYVAGDATRRATTSTENPLNRPFAGRMGLDAKTALGSSLTLDATVNPDFGQVEADPAEVNLSAFETFFDERRPFFTEGSEMVRGNGAQYFYPRRIGAAPHGSATGDFVDVPRSSTILGAAKLTGRLPSRLSIGAVTAVTAAEQARVFRADSGVTNAVQVEPRSAYGVLRLQQEIGSQASTIGASFSTVQRSVGGQSALAALLARESYFGGADWRIRFQQGKYAISGFVAGSHVAGDTASIRRLQVANSRLFQRPDRRTTVYDALKTSLSGYSAQLRADKDAGQHILAGAEVKIESPGFEINDLGRLQSTDDIEYNADVQIRETTPGRFLQNWRLGFETRGAWNFERTHQLNTWSQNSSATLKNFWNLNVRSTIALATVDDAITRGGPYMGLPREFRQEFRINNPFGARTGWRVNGGYGVDEFGAWRRNVSGQVTLRPSPRVSVSMEPTVQSGTEPRQYVTRIAGGTRTFGNRYVFAFIDRTTISTKLRANYAFSPNLSLEAYAEPFVATGRYSRMGELSAPRSRMLREYGTDGTTIATDSAGTRTITDGTQSFTIGNRDFNILSFRSNMVMRWEWTPGSTFFLVWQQNRRTAEAFGDPARARDLFRTTRASGDNFLAVKVSYWLPVRLGGRR